MSIGIPILFGIPQAVADSHAAAIAISIAPANALGAELLAVADAYSRVEPQQGHLFQNVVDFYREELGRGNVSGTKRFQQELSTMAKKIAPTQWKDIVGILPSWATMGGFFATPQPEKIKYPHHSLGNLAEVVRDILFPPDNLVFITRTPEDLVRALVHHILATHSLNEALDIFSQRYEKARRKLTEILEVSEKEEVVLFLRLWKEEFTKQLEKKYNYKLEVT